MNYELAKQLKDAGFSQELNNGDWAYFEDEDGFVDIEELQLMHDDNDEGGFVGNSYSYRYEDHKPEQFIKCPTLSKLIDACGGELSSLQSVFGAKRWYANSFGRIEEPCLGSTPEEAVAKLWLELNLTNN